MVSSNLFLVILIIIIITIFIAVTYRQPSCSACVRKEHMATTKTKPIYCLMVTGKDENRYEFAKISIMNFIIQTYNNKHLLIVNHGTRRLVNNNNNYIKEFMVSKENKTLGDLRNISLSYVPDGEIFTTWDDDDWRSADYLQQLYDVLITNNAQLVMLKNRLEYNLNNGSAWKSSLNSGFYWFFMVKDPNLKYDSLDKNEDGIIKTKAYELHKKIIVYDNDPKIYIRYIHKNNTSPYVNKDKANPNPSKGDYNERAVTEDERRYLSNIHKYINKAL